MKHDIFGTILIVGMIFCMFWFVDIMFDNQEKRCASSNGNHTFLVYYTSTPDTLRVFGSYELTSNRGTNQIYRIECDELSPKCILSTTAPIKHIFNK